MRDGFTLSPATYPLAGVFPALITPLGADGARYLDALAPLAEFGPAQGIRGFQVGGMAMGPGGSIGTTRNIIGRPLAPVRTAQQAKVEPVVASHLAAC